ncbi:GNAT family N-acetyltransferase [Clostridium sp. FP2]|uniref:GNAT family N-acetyltransferase n=1 Tax=Clostridium sp. FP2 TaxID=2724481 RepID=UPI0013E95B25|nr:GNAT family N-acetyltransferase [Clostridium sp. FP2]MBZ9623835.1 GNAT family N-acetyltransferase [Clostridium sp. FP2]
MGNIAHNGTESLRQCVKSVKLRENFNRKKGVGTYIISKLKEHCISNDLVPICGCAYNNYASKKTLEKAGFITIHRIVRFEF